MNGTVEIGFSQRLQLEWLERTAGLVSAGATRADIEDALQKLLQDRLSVGGNAERGNREKAISILLKTWFSVPRNLESFRNDGLNQWRGLHAEEHLPVHWGMTIAVYPFFGVVAETVGRLLRLQGSLAASQVQRRVREQLGERETVSRAARRILRCFIDWGVLIEGGKRGVYQPAPTRAVGDRRLATWLVEAVLLSGNAKHMPLKAAFQAPMLFPFAIAPLRITELEIDGRLESFRQGLDEDIVALREKRERR